MSSRSEEESFQVVQTPVSTGASCTDTCSKFFATGSEGGTFMGALQNIEDDLVALTKPNVIERKLFFDVFDLISTEINRLRNTTLEGLKAYCDEGHWSWRVLGFLAGLMLTVSAFFNFIYHLLIIQLWFCLADALIFFFGQLLIFIEYKYDILPRFMMQSLREEALFLFRPYGRSYLYTFFGFFVLTQVIAVNNYDIVTTYLYIPTGIFTICVGFIVGHFSHTALAQLQKFRNDRKLNEAELKRLFHASKGYWAIENTLGTIEFIEFVKAVGLNMNHNEIETALITLDSNFDGRIDFQEFMMWYNEIQLTL
jgi:hypothetical protein